MSCVYDKWRITGVKCFVEDCKAHMFSKGTDMFDHFICWSGHRCCMIKPKEGGFEKYECWCLPPKKDEVVEPCVILGCKFEEETVESYKTWLKTIEKQ